MDKAFESWIEPGVIDVEVVRGSAAAGAAPRVLIEVPHGADRRAHYEALRARMIGVLPEELHMFFHINTDVGAYQLGRGVAQGLVEADPSLSVVVVRCLIPRTFIDCNRVADAPGGKITEGALTAGLQPYIRDAKDQALLLGLHQRYLAAARGLYQAVCGAGGFGLIPHTYGPVSMGIEQVDEHIVQSLRWAHEPARYATWKVRAEVDLITRTGEGVELAPAGLDAELVRRFASLGVEVEVGGTYFLHPATMGAVWSRAYPGQVLCLEVRRDLLVQAWSPFEEMEVDAAKVARFVGPLVAVVRGWLDQQPKASA